MSTLAPARQSRARRLLAATTAAVIGGAGSILAVSGAASPATAAPTAKAIVSVVKDTSDPSGMRVTVTGSGFDPSLATGTRPPFPNQPAGTYVVFGKFAHHWQPSSGGSGRTYSSQMWAVPAAQVNMLGDRGTVLSPEGTFTTSLVLDPQDPTFNGVDGRWGVYTYAGSGAIQAAYETFTPITFHDEGATDPDWSDFSIQAGVTVTPTAAADGETVTVRGYSFDPSAVSGTALLPGRPAGAFVLFGRFPAVWQPSKGVDSSHRKADSATRRWAVLAEDFGAITDDDHEGAIELKPDGTFTTTIVVNRRFTGVPPTGRFGIYTYAGDIGNAYAPYETFTPITEPGTAKPAKASSTVALRLAKKKVKAGTKAKAVVKVTASSGVATGKVAIKRGKKTLRTVTLKAKDAGRKTLRLPRLAKGKHRLRAVYAGSATVTGSTSAKVVLRVVKKPKKKKK